MPPTSPRRNGGSLSPSSLKLNSAAGPAPTRPASYWTPSSTQCVAVAPGACFLTSSRPGRPSTTTSVLGASMAPGSASTASCAQARPREGGSRSDAQRGDHGQSVGEDHGERRRSRLRRYQEDKRPQTPPFGGYGQTGDEAKSASC